LYRFLYRYLYNSLYRKTLSSGRGFWFNALSGPEAPPLRAPEIAMLHLSLRFRLAVALTLPVLVVLSPLLLLRLTPRLASAPPSPLAPLHLVTGPADGALSSGAQATGSTARGATAGDGGPLLGLLSSVPRMADLLRRLPQLCLAAPPSPAGSPLTAIPRSWACALLTTALHPPP